MFVFDVTHLSEENCDDDFNKSMKYLLKSRGKSEIPADGKTIMTSMELDRFQ
jgi:hypothetical protein